MKNNFFEKLNMMIVNIIFTLVLTVGFSYYFLTQNMYVAFSFLLAAYIVFAAVNIAVYFIKKKLREEKLKHISFAARGKEVYAGESAVNNFGLPLAFVSDFGSFIWCNEQFEELFNDKSSMRQELRDIFKLHIAPKIDLLADDFSFELSINNKQFLVKTAVVNHVSGSRDGYSVMIYLIDKTAEKEIKHLYESQRIAVGELVVDSYEDIYQTNGEIVINRINVELSKIIDRWLSGKRAVARKMVRDRYFIVMEYDSLQEIMKEKFSILDKIINFV